MNCIEYGFHRLYLRFASNEVLQREAIGRITDNAREKVALEKLVADIALIHESGVPSLPYYQLRKSSGKSFSEIANKKKQYGRKIGCVAEWDCIRG
jgi:hypothetical protein